MQGQGDYEKIVAECRYVILRSALRAEIAVRGGAFGPGA
jgi:hypothetical protein